MLLDPDARPIIAHRGASGGFPENTMLAFRRGLAEGADALEFDVRLTADGVAVVIHDPTVDRTTNGSGPVGQLQLAELTCLDAGSGERVPTVSEVLESFPDTPLIIEVKEARASAELARVLLRQGASGRVLVGSFDHRALRPFGAPTFGRAASRIETALFWAGSRINAGLAGARYSAFTVPERHGNLTVVDRRFVRAAGRRGKPVHVWTVDRISEAERLRTIGVAGLITNFPARMRDLCA